MDSKVITTPLTLTEEPPTTLGAGASTPHMQMGEGVLVAVVEVVVVFVVVVVVVVVVVT